MTFESWSLVARILRRNGSSSTEGRKPRLSRNVDAGIRATALAIAWSILKLPVAVLLRDVVGEDLVVVASHVLGEQPANVAGVAPQLAVRKGSLLERAERLHPLVRLARAVVARARRGRPRAGQCRRTRRAASRGRRRAAVPLLGRAGCRQGSAAGVSNHRLLRPGAARVLSPTTAQIFSSAVLPTKFVISQRLSILARSALPAVTAATFPVLTSTKWHSKWSVPRSPSMVTFSLYAGWSDSHCVSGWNATTPARPSGSAPCPPPSSRGRTCPSRSVRTGQPSG